MNANYIVCWSCILGNMEVSCMFIALLEMSSAALTGSVRSALLRGWRERWTDEHWSVAVKRHFPQGANGDACQLAGECCVTLLI